MAVVNHRILLAERPVGIPGPQHFQAGTEPVRPPGPGEMLVATRYISIDPAMRSWIGAGPAYVRQVGIGEPMRAGGIAQVLESRAAGFQAGDWVQGRTGWQSHPTLRGDQTQKLDLAVGTIEDWAGPLGTSALTAYFGLRDVGALRPGDTLLVSGAAGGVGQIAAQIGQIEACRVVGIAGGAEKCRFLLESLRLDAVIDYKAERDIDAAIRRACPSGVDVYFDNVGGAILDGALTSLRLGARVVSCGRISQAGLTEPYGVKNLGALGGKRVRMQGYLVFDYHDRYGEARTWLAHHLRAGRLRQRLHVVDGLDHAPEALAMLFNGGNTGKLVVRVGG
jgi:NADPH-dependent curcumin reductase CurA